MNRSYIHLIPILTLSWLIYGQCQEDSLLPPIAMTIMIITFFLRVTAQGKSFKFMSRVSLVAILIISIVAGIIWRIFTPAPITDDLIFIDMVYMLQPFTIIAASLIWLKPYSKENIYWLTGLSWATVALSINVPFDDYILSLFRLFCILSAVNILLHTLKKPPVKKRYLLHIRQLLVFGLILMVCTGILFTNIAHGIVIFDEVFMRFIGDYVVPRSYTHFLNISPILRLTNPGYSAIDKRPVLEIDAEKSGVMYLKTQVFENYEDGMWTEPEDVNYVSIGNISDPTLLRKDMIMYTYLEDIIPSPYGISGVRGRDTFLKDTNHIIYGESKKRTRKLSLAINKEPPKVYLNKQEREHLTQLSNKLQQPLFEHAKKIINGETNRFQIAAKIEKHFRDNYQYTLLVDFHATEDGILEMLKEKKSAYCSYFATAMTLLLRSQGIPSRVATGFVAEERIGRKKDKYLVRVRNAHAWSEAYIPIESKETKEIFMTWVPFDPTPPIARGNVINQSGPNLSFTADMLWLFILRTMVYVQNIDKDQAKKNILIILTASLILMNFKKITNRLRNIKLRSNVRERSRSLQRKDVEEIYHRYEDYILKTFNESRNDPETDSQVLGRLKQKSEIPQETLAKIHSFVDHYRDVRFGYKTNVQLERIIETLEEDANT